MARQLKPRPQSEYDKVCQRIMNLGKGRQFETSFLANQVIAALLSRIRRSDPKEAQFLIRNISLLSTLERTAQSSRQEIADFLDGKVQGPTPTALTQTCPTHL